MKKLLAYAVCVSTLLTIAIHADELRTWTSASGQKMEAELIGISEDGKSVTLRRSDGKEGNVALDKLSSADKSYVARQKRALDKANEEKKKAEEERKAWLSAIDLKEELKKGGFDSLSDFAYYGTEELKDKLRKSDAFDRPAVEAEIINTARKKIAQKTFVVEFTATECLAKDKMDFDLKVNGNKSSFIMSIPFDIKFSEVRAISFPWPNVAGNVTKAISSPYKSGAGGFAYLSLPVSGDTENIKELVRNSDNFRVKVLFKILYTKINLANGGGYGVGHSDRTYSDFSITIPTAEILKIEVVKAK